MPFPEEHGGLGGSVLDMAIIAEELARKSFDFFTAYGASVFCGLNLLRNGTPEQCERYLPKLIAGDIRMCVSMSEPDAGSDTGAMRSTARRDGERLAHQRAEAVVDRRRRPRHPDQRLRQDRHQGPLPRGYLTVPHRQRRARRRAAQARHAGSALRRDLRDLLQRCRGSRRAPCRRRQSRVPLPALRLADRAHHHRCRLLRRGPGGARSRGRLREDPQAVRASDRVVPGDRAPAGGPADRGRRRPAA